MPVHFVAAELTADSPGHASAVFTLPESIASNVDYDRYRGNSLLAWAHSWDAEPVGTADQMTIDGNTVTMHFRLDPSTKFHDKVSRGFVRTAEMLFEQSESGGPWELMDVSLVSHATPNYEHLDSAVESGGTCDCRGPGPCICVRFDGAPKPQPQPPPQETPMSTRDTPPARWREPLAATHTPMQVTPHQDSADPDGEVQRRANVIRLTGSLEPKSARAAREAHNAELQRRLDAGERPSDIIRETDDSLLRRPHETESVWLLRQARAKAAKQRMDASMPHNLPDHIPEPRAFQVDEMPQRWREPLAFSAPRVQAEALHSVAEALSRRPPPDDAA